MSTNQKDEELIALIARTALKDEAAFQELYHRLGGYLNSVALRIVKSPDTSSEVLQEAFVQIWQNADSYRPHLAKPLTWVTSIVRYRALDRLDKETRIGQREVSGDEKLEAMPADHNPEGDTNQQQRFEQLLACMETLNDRGKEAITMAYVFGYSRTEIAKRLNTNASTVKSWLRRGSEKLRRCLQQQATK